MASLPLDSEVLTATPPHRPSLTSPVPQQGGGREPCYGLAGWGLGSALTGVGPRCVVQGLPEVEPLLSINFLPGEAAPFLLGRGGFPVCARGLVQAIDFPRTPLSAH